MQLKYVSPADALFPAAATLRYEILHRPLGLPADADYDDADPASQHLVAVRDGRVVGYARLITADRSARIRHIAVHPDERRRGLGARMAEELVTKARASGVTLVWVNARFTAIGFWRSLGFHTAGQLTQAEDTHLPHQRMEMRL